MTAEFLKRSVVGLVLSGICTPALACTVSATSLQFGLIDPLASGDTVSSSIVTVRCDAAASYVISLSTGAGSYAQRYMENGSNRLVYNLYSDASFSNIWGDGTGGSQTVNGTTLGGSREYSVYGRVPHQPAAVPGTYVDSIVVTVTF